MTLVDVANGKSRHVPYRDSRLTFLLQVQIHNEFESSISLCPLSSLAHCIIFSRIPLEETLKQQLLPTSARLFGIDIVHLYSCIRFVF